MAKDSFWFKHDYNARNDEKILELRSVYGAESYGLYWMIIESMAETGYGGIKSNLIGGLSLSYGVAKDRLIDIIKYCIEIGLFYEEDGIYFSKRMLKHKQEREDFSINGKIGAENRWKNRGANRGAIATPMQRRGEERRKDIKNGIFFSENGEVVFFDDNTSQPLGKDQKALYDMGQLKPKDIIKGLIN